MPHMDKEIFKTCQLKVQSRHRYTPSPLMMQCQRWSRKPDPHYHRGGVLEVQVLRRSDDKVLLNRFSSDLSYEVMSYDSVVRHDDIHVLASLPRDSSRTRDMTIITYYGGVTYGIVGQRHSLALHRTAHSSRSLILAERTPGLPCRKQSRGVCVCPHL